MRENKNNPGGSQSGQDRSNQNLSEKQRGNQNVGRDLDNQNQGQNLGQGQEQFRGTSGTQGGQGGTHARNEPGVRNPGQQNIDEPVMSDEDEIGGVGRPEHGRSNQPQQPQQPQQRRSSGDTDEK